MKNRKTITFPNDLIIWIENYRANLRPIPTFTDAVIDLLRIARIHKKY